MSILKLIEQFGNDFELGRVYRKYTLRNIGELDEHCIDYPNDIKLGKFIREKYSKLS